MLRRRVLPSARATKKEERQETERQQTDQRTEQMEAEVETDAPDVYFGSTYAPSTSAPGLSTEHMEVETDEPYVSGDSLVFELEESSRLAGELFANAFFDGVDDDMIRTPESQGEADAEAQREVDPQGEDPPQGEGEVGPQGKREDSQQEEGDAPPQGEGEAKVHLAEEEAPVHALALGELQLDVPYPRGPSIVYAGSDWDSHIVVAI